MLLEIFLHDIVPVFLIAGAGLALARGVGTQVQALTHVVFYILIPALVFEMLMTTPSLGADAPGLAAVAGLAMVSMVVIGAALGAGLRLSRIDTRALLLIVTFSNTGNYGLPVVHLAFGDAALARATVFFVANSVLTYALGTLIAAGARGGNLEAWQRLWRLPTVQAVVLALALRALGVTVPEPVMHPVSLLSDAALPTMILVLGMQLYAAGWPTRLPLVAGAVAVSLVISPLVAYGWCLVFGIDGPSRQAAVLLSSMPVAVTTTILAVEFDVSPALVTSAVLVSTVLSPLTLTPLIAWLG